MSASFNKLVNASKSIFLKIKFEKNEYYGICCWIYGPSPNSKKIGKWSKELWFWYFWAVEDVFLWSVCQKFSKLSKKKVGRFAFSSIFEAFYAFLRGKYVLHFFLLFYIYNVPADKHIKFQTAHIAFLYIAILCTFWNNSQKFVYFLYVALLK